MRQRLLTRAVTVTAAMGLLVAAPFGASGQAAPGRSARTAGSIPSGAPAPLYRVQVAQWAQPVLRVRDSPGWPGGHPGNVIGSMRPGAAAMAVCSTQGADMTAYGRTGSTWVKISPGSPPTAWLWDGGLNPHEVLPPCVCGCPRIRTDRGAGATACGDCRAREEDR
ncbi:hypothetical protein [Actinomadura luteofluorescens]|uniref:hypothetical protein n=1 Tax=Actinomadura luteofluorescens TaxID=46163 RepID=UPI0030CCECE1